MSEQVNGNKKWVLYIRTMATLAPFVFAVFWWWFRSITVMAIENQRDCAVLKSENQSIKSDIAYIRNRIDEAIGR